MTKSEKFWNRIASKEIKSLGATSQKTIEATIPYLKPTDKVLDFGCGEGTITYRIAEYVGAIHGIDFSSAMIEAAQTNAHTLNIQNVHFSNTNLFDDDLKPETFDVVVAFNVLHHIKDAKSIIQRIQKLLKPNGVFISTTACLGQKKSFQNILLQLIIGLQIIPKIQLYKTADLENMITSSGFEILKCSSLTPLPEYFIVVQKS